MSSFLKRKKKWSVCFQSPPAAIVLLISQAVDAVSRNMISPPLKDEQSNGTGTSTHLSPSHHPAMVIFGGLFLGVPIIFFILLLTCVRCCYGCYNILCNRGPMKASGPTSSVFSSDPENSLDPVDVYNVDSESF